MRKIAHLRVVQFSASFIHALFAVQPKLVNIVDLGTIEVHNSLFPGNELILEQMLANLRAGEHKVCEAPHHNLPLDGGAIFEDLWNFLNAYKVKICLQMASFLRTEFFNFSEQPIYWIRTVACLVYHSVNGYFDSGRLFVLFSPVTKC
jgi:hypothetical protein